MNPPAPSLDLSRLRVLPLASRRNLTRIDEILISPESAAKPLPENAAPMVPDCASAIRAARQRGAAVILIYGAHLVKNGGALILESLMEQKWLTHLATNGAGTIHDWEYAWLGASSESVKTNVASGTFGAWDETATNIHLALMTGALDGLGYGQALGRFISEDGTDVPAESDLERLIRAEPAHPLTAARADLLRAIRRRWVAPGRLNVLHRWKHASVLASAWKHNVPMTVHPGIGYDIISNHPIFNGGVLGRAAEWDFKLFGGSVTGLEGGVVLSVGSAIMGPQVFEKSLSCVNNLRLQEGCGPVAGHTIYVVDLQDGGGWDWTLGEPPKTSPAYYLRFCKSFSRMGAPMRYVQCDNVTFLHNLQRILKRA
ncbi:MAG: hypothetical protein ABSG59_14620 [Verrucomicrobiota bacterium]|jgi:hypothetical protein